MLVSRKHRNVVAYMVVKWQARRLSMKCNQTHLKVCEGFHQLFQEKKDSLRKQCDRNTGCKHVKVFLFDVQFLVYIYRK